MRVLCATTANDGHFGPLLPFARACAAAGHEVRVAAPESFAGTVAAAGLAHEPFADAPPELIGPVMGRLPELEPEEADNTVVREVFARIDAQAGLPAVMETIERWRPDVVIRESAELASLAKRSVTARVLGSADAEDRESPLRITLAQGIARGEKLDWVLQKATELGVARILPVNSERSEVKLDAQRADKRHAHWREVVVSACEQSGRATVPDVAAPQALAQAAASREGRSFILDPFADTSLAA